LKEYNRHKKGARDKNLAPFSFKEEAL